MLYCFDFWDWLNLVSVCGFGGWFLHIQNCCDLLFQVVVAGAALLFQVNTKEFQGLIFFRTK